MSAKPYVPHANEFARADGNKHSCYKHVPGGYYTPLSNWLPVTGRDLFQNPCDFCEYPCDYSRVPEYDAEDLNGTSTITPKKSLKKASKTMPKTATASATVAKIVAKSTRKPRTAAPKETAVPKTAKTTTAVKPKPKPKTTAKANKAKPKKTLAPKMFLAYVETPGEDGGDMRYIGATEATNLRAARKSAIEEFGDDVQVEHLYSGLTNTIAAYAISKPVESVAGNGDTLVIRLKHVSDIGNPEVESDEAAFIEAALLAYALRLADKDDESNSALLLEQDVASVSIRPLKNDRATVTITFDA